MAVRAAVILMLGRRIAVAAGMLTALAGNAWAVAALAAGGAYASTVAVAGSAIGCPGHRSPKP
ncbi:hypothetical protein [Streptomyces sp. NPDC127020]|uniref:hypothetical protein n=1 Tax=Streptomyces sp. NPDC127020 TaxID=3347109 RepID=UPI003648D635